MIKASDAIKKMQNQMIIFNEFVEEAQQFNFEDFDLLDRVNLEEEEVVVENSEDTDDAIERQSVTQERGRWVNVLKNNVGKICSNMFCGAHVFQLAAKEVTEPFEATLDEMRKFIRNTRAPKYDAIIFKNTTQRYCSEMGSTYIMVSDMFEKLAVYEQIGTNQNNRELRLYDETWKFIEEYTKAFEPIFYTMKDFQRSDNTISDFFLRWMRMVMNLEKIADGLNFKFTFTKIF